MRIRIYLTLALLIVWVGPAVSPVEASPQTQELKGEVLDEQGAPIAGAVCTLTGRPLPEAGLPVKTGEKGEFRFTGLLAATYDLTCAALGHEPVAQTGLQISEAPTPFLQVVLPEEIVIRERVEIRAKPPIISQEPAAPPATISSQQLRTLPLIQQKFKAALPLVPGVVRTPDGKINIKGVVESQGLLLVDLAETVDPVTGSFSIEVPIDAVESVEVYKSAYRAEYGRFAGGLTSVQTKAPLNRWSYELNDLLPELRIRGGQVVGIRDESPRLSLTGPLWPNRLNFSESFAYDLNKQPVRGLPWPRNETKKQGFDSFTSFQFIVSPRHLLTANVKLFPMRRQFADISSLVPQSASADYGQRGFSIGATDRYLFASGGVLTTLVQYTNFASRAHGQGPLDMLVTPNGWGGNFFNSWTRNSHQQEGLETYQFPRREWHGRHDLKLGADFVHRSYSGTSVSRPVQILRPDGKLLARIDFLGTGSLSAQDTEVAGFIQDHWAFNQQLALDLGLRYSGQTLGASAAFAPRMGVVYSPGKGGRTILRAGVGLFYDHLPLLACDFTKNPTRQVSFFDEQGNLVGLPLVYHNAYVAVDEKGRHIIPPGRNLASTPYNLTWNLEVDREIRPHLVVRFSYLSSRTYKVFIIDPQQLPGNNAVLLLTNTGGSRYHELESTLRLRAGENTDFNVSYVHSLGRGDLNTLSAVAVPFEQPVIRPNALASLPSNIPDRLVTWAQLRIPWRITASPLLDVHSGFPYSALDAGQNYVGNPNSLRFPAFISLDLQLSKDFRLRFLPWIRNHTLRGTLRIFNVTNHPNPRDVYNNIASPFFGHFVGFQHRFFDTALDIVY